MMYVHTRADVMLSARVLTETGLATKLAASDPAKLGSPSLLENLALQRQILAVLFVVAFFARPPEFESTHRASPKPVPLARNRGKLKI